MAMAPDARTRLTFEAVATAVSIAEENWLDWQDVFGHQGLVRENPLLNSRFRFGCFVWEYNLGRTLPVGNAKPFRNELLLDVELHQAFEDGDAGAFCAKMAYYSKKYSAKKSAGGLRSLMSKLAAFCNPSAFMAYDGFASRGLGLLYGSKPQWDRDLSVYRTHAISFARNEAN